MIASEKSRQNLTEYIHFLLKKDFNSIEERFFSSEKIRNSGNYVYNYASFFGEVLQSYALCWFDLLLNGGSCENTFVVISDNVIPNDHIYASTNLRTYNATPLGGIC